MPRVGGDLAVSASLVHAWEQLLAGELHWVHYKFEVSKKRAALVAEGPRLHDNPTVPFQRVLEQRRKRQRQATSALAVEMETDAIDDASTTSATTASSVAREPKVKRDRMLNNVGRPLPKYSSIPGFDVRPEAPPPPKVTQPRGAIEFLRVPLRLALVDFFGPEELLAMATASGAWFEVCVSEAVWATLALRLKVLSPLDVVSLTNQKMALRARGFADGRAWAAACLFGSSWRDFVHRFPRHRPGFGAVDLLHAPGLSDKSPARRMDTQTTKAGGHTGLFGPTNSKHQDPRRIVIVFWDPVDRSGDASLHALRCAQLAHLAQLQELRFELFNEATHFLHAREAGDLRLSRVLTWVRHEVALEGEFLSHGALWEDRVMQSTEFHTARDRAVVAVAQHRGKAQAEERRKAAAAAEAEAERKRKHMEARKAKRISERAAKGLPVDPDAPDWDSLSSGSLISLPPL